MDTSALFFSIFNLGGQPILDILMIFGAKDLIYVVYFLVLVAVVRGNTDSRKAFILSLLGLGIALIAIDVIRSYYYAQRPFEVFPIQTLITPPNDASFPSKHTTIASIIAFAYGHYRTKVSYLLIIAALWIGFARVYVGVHYPIDIIGGVIVAAVSVYLATHTRRFLKEII